MQAESWTEFDREMALLCEAFDRKKTGEIIDSYWQALSKMSMHDFKVASLFARENAGKDGMTRLPMPGRFWSLRDEANRKAEPFKRPDEPKVSALPRQQHLAHLRRNAINVAIAETQPKFKGYVIGFEYLPEHVKAEYAPKWKQWFEDYGDKDDDFWWPRARELMSLWGEKNADEAIPGDRWAA